MMTTRSKKITELPAITSVSSNDLFVVEQFVSNTSTSTSKITGINLRKGMVRGPYANDAAAATGGVAVGEMYYTAAGDVKVRLV